METFWNTILWQQFGAAIDMLENAMRACPDELWSVGLPRTTPRSGCALPSQKPAWNARGIVGFWHLVYHTLFFLDFDLADSPLDFAPPPPFALTELDPEGALPERPYTKDELQRYLDHCRREYRAVIQNLGEEQAREPSRSRPEFSRAELLLYSLRHVQHHTAQLNLILRQETGDAPRWVRRASS